MICRALSAAGAGTSAHTTNATAGASVPRRFCRSFILERLDKRPADGDFGGPHRGEQRRTEYHRHDEERDRDRKLIVEPDSRHVLSDDLEHEVQVEGAERHAERDAE